MRTRSFPYLFALLAALGMIYGLWQYDRFRQFKHRQAIREQASTELSDLSSRLSWMVNSRVNIARTLAAYASVSPKMSEKEFAALVANLTLRRRDDSPLWVALFKGDDIRYVSRKEGSCAFAIEKLSENPEMAAVVEMARQTNDPAFFGPVRGDDGDLRLVALAPVFEANGPDDMGKYWGIAAVEFRLRATFRRAGLIEQNAPLWVSVRQVSNNDPIPTSLYGDQFIFNQSSVHDSIELSDDIRWELAAVPAEGWGHLAPSTMRYWMAGLALTLALSLLAWFLSRIPAQLSKAVRDATAALRDSEERFRSLFEATFEAVMVHDDGIVLDVNKAFETMFGYTLAELIGREGHVVVAEHCRPLMRSKMNTRDTSPYELEMVRKDGTRFHAETVGKDHVYRGQNVRVVAIRDITERKMAETALRQQMEFETLLNSISAQFINIRPEAFSEGMELALRTLGRHLAADSIYVVRFSDKPMMQDLVYEWTATGTEAPVGGMNQFFTGQIPWIMSNLREGKSVHISHLAEFPSQARMERAFFEKRGTIALAAMPLQASGTTIGMLGFESHRPDISWAESQIAQLKVVAEMFAGAIERKRADETLQEALAELDTANRMLQQHSATLKTRVEERTLELAQEREKALQASRAKSEFLSTMSHELRTPLNSILGLAQVVLMKVGSTLPEQQKENLQAIVASGKRLLELINQLLDLSRIEEGRLDLKISEFSVNSPVFEAFESVKPLAENKHLRYVLVNETQGLRLQSDSDKLVQILINLLGNAVKFTSKGEISLTVRQEGEEAIFIVRDTGIGIPPDQLERVFEPFRQGDSSSTRRHGGSGLGLAISRRLTLMLGGTLKLESEVGTGATFILRLPCKISTEAGKIEMQV